MSSGAPFDAQRLLVALETLTGLEVPDQANLEMLRTNSHRLRRLLSDIRSAHQFLDRLHAALDVVLIPKMVFDVTSPKIIAEVAVFTLEQQPKLPLATLPAFYGSGIYAFYYQGDFPAYEAIRGTSCPIYVGSSVSKIPSSNPILQGIKLFGRIREHREKSIRESRNLSLEDFSCRYLVVQSGLEKAAEDFLIRRYYPVWNKESKVCSGIGKHGDVARTELSDWDILHGNRQWATGQTSRRGTTPEIIQGRIQDHFRELLFDDPDRWSEIFNKAWIKRQRE
jgi:Eco29kI restriction endonuclease